MTRRIHIVLAEKNPDFIKILESVLSNNFDCSTLCVSSPTEVLDGLKDSTKLLIGDAELLLQQDTTLIRSILGEFPNLHILPAVEDDNNEIIDLLSRHELNNYVNRPYLEQEIYLTVKKALRLSSAQAKSSTPKKSKNIKQFHGIIGQSEKMQKLYHLISKIADDDFSTVLIRGESGTGKELVAKAIHTHSRRNKKNFVPVNCAAIPDDLLESELFGHTKGAFTGANTSKQGRIQYADGGTLFLDEIGDMKSSLQAKLLRVLQEKEFEPVGALKPIPVDTRIVAATHCDLEQLVSEGKFREDLYYRLSVIPLNLPPLRERVDDIEHLLENFIEKFTSQRGRKPFTFSKAAYACLKTHKWRGNVRELQNLVQHMSILYSGEHIDVADLPERYKTSMNIHQEPPKPTEFSVQPDERFALQQPPPQEPQQIPEVSWDEDGVDFKELINDFETKLIVQAMKMADGNKKEAARILNLKRTTLLEKIKKKDISTLWEG